MKRALKKRVKAVLNNTPNSDGVLIEPSNETIHKTNRRAGTQAAMIGLAISMGATSLLVTRQSDQAQAAAPVGSQKAASTIPAASDTEIKFAATKLESQAVPSASVPENPVIVGEPTAVSQMPGLEAKWPVAAKEMAVQIQTSEANKNAVYLQPQVEQGLNNNSVQSRLQTEKPLSQTESQFSQNQGVADSLSPVVIVESANPVSNDVNAQLKAQQEFALNRLQEKSNRLRNSLAQLRPDETNKFSEAGIEVAQPTTVADNSLPVQSSEVIDANQADLISRLKQDKQTSAPVQKALTPAPAPAVVAQLATTTYEVKPGDTLAEIADNYGTSVSDIIKANNLDDPNQLQISQKLIIPTAKAERTSYTQPTVAISPTFIRPSSNPKLAVSPLSKPDPEANLPLIPQSPVESNNNSVAIPVPVVKQSPVESNNNSVAIPVPVVKQSPVARNNSSVAIPVPLAGNQLPPTPETEFTAPNSLAVGGDNSQLDIATETQTEQQLPQKTAKLKGPERIRSLQAEIERLREKYRAQKSGVTVANVDETENTPVPVVVEKANNQTNFPVNAQLNAVSISVPKPIQPGYSQQPVKPLVSAARPNNEPINPQFISRQTALPGNSSGSSSSIRLNVPTAGVNSSDSLGNLRGTRVSPALPPLAAVDLYLPKSVEETTEPSSSTAHIWPAKGVLTSGYGWRWGRMHRGIDIANGVGTPIYASSAGRVERAGWNNGGYGLLVDIRHADGSLTRYAHNSRILVQVGQEVEQGQIIAAMGSTGFSTGSHIHFEVHPAGKGAVNPIAFLPSRTQARL
ncbi:peptidoglycan DD-metalloendopeptidase family protein [Sphaerospermopsis sp. FACHB-1094]|nr:MULTISPECIES: peptidoglycan DD-metalloendopeptidase family protein [unclassified Sphaerospermopsis]MBD2131767.1 peptidoglycan DD-metalloendopeptidase family protein [Sphaerospermopsis sp. FACHB-1094]MBD2145959.1 peptidoglycan DD-metalloendopeptidase family protein [Sphaerospermopsis sp. FACHB-1194]